MLGPVNGRFDQTIRELKYIHSLKVQIRHSDIWKNKDLTHIWLDVPRGVEGRYIIFGMRRKNFDAEEDAGEEVNAGCPDDDQTHCLEHSVAAVDDGIVLHQPAKLSIVRGTVDKLVETEVPTHLQSFSAQQVD
jgi:hypothetical protein